MESGTRFKRPFSMEMSEYWSGPATTTVSNGSELLRRTSESVEGVVVLMLYLPELLLVIDVTDVLRRVRA